MGLKARLDLFRKNILISESWHTPWLSAGTGGILLFTCTLFFISVLGVISTYTTHTLKQQELLSTKKELEHVKNLFFLDEQYQSAFDNKSSSQLSTRYTKFNQPTSFSAMKAYLQKWQKILKIKTLTVTMEPTKPHNRGKNIMTAPIRLVAHVLNDKMLYQLIEKLQSDAPGFIVIRHIDLKRIAGPSPETIDKLISGKANTLIEGTIICDWFYMDTPKQ